VTITRIDDHVRISCIHDESAIIHRALAHRETRARKEVRAYVANAGKGTIKAGFFRSTVLRWERLRELVEAMRSDQIRAAWGINSTSLSVKDAVGISDALRSLLDFDKRDLLDPKLTLAESSDAALIRHEIRKAVGLTSKDEDA
jgi:hypothetical protein|tara:strand:- start:615 stop:1046 length:432 start_codon:yes stop_codon:yes gene_type:complete